MKLPLLASFALFSAPIAAQKNKEETVTIWNTFQDANSTGGAEVLYQVNEATISDNVEFELFPANPPGTPEGGFYNIDIDLSDKKEGTVTWTLKDNLGASHLVFDEGTYDRYYLIFEKPIYSATIESSDSIVAHTSIPFYEERETVDFFGVGKEFPTLTNKVLKLFVEPTTDLTTLEQQIVVKISRDKKDMMGDDSHEGDGPFSAITDFIKDLLGLD